MKIGLLNPQYSPSFKATMNFADSAEKFDKKTAKAASNENSDKFVCLKQEDCPLSSPAGKSGNCPMAEKLEEKVSECIQVLKTLGAVKAKKEFPKNDSFHVGVIKDRENESPCSAKNQIEVAYSVNNKDGSKEIKPVMLYTPNPESTQGQFTDNLNISLDRLKETLERDKAKKQEK